jgi:hypothetical protein
MLDKLCNTSIFRPTKTKPKTQKTINQLKSSHKNQSIDNKSRFKPGKLHKAKT